MTSIHSIISSKRYDVETKDAMSRLLVCGDRNWTNLNRVREVIQLVQNPSVIIAGECQGADLCAKTVAAELNIPYLGFPADWRTHGRAAGPIRNNQMLGASPTIILAFHNDINSSKGTKHMLSISKYIPRYLITDTSIVQYI